MLRAELVGFPQALRRRAALLLVGIDGAAVVRGVWRGPARCCLTRRPRADLSGVICNAIDDSSSGEGDSAIVKLKAHSVSPSLASSVEQSDAILLPTRRPTSKPKRGLASVPPPAACDRHVGISPQGGQCYAQTRRRDDQ